MLLSLLLSCHFSHIALLPESSCVFLLQGNSIAPPPLPHHLLPSLSSSPSPALVGPGGDLHPSLPSQPQDGCRRVFTAFPAPSTEKLVDEGVFCFLMGGRRDGPSGSPAHL